MKKVKEEKGAITIIVLVSLIFFVSFLVSTYLILANKSQSQLEIIEQTKEIYDNSESITDIYNSYFADEVIPIYTVEQLLKIGTGDNIVIKEAGNKIYNFGQDSTYMLMNDLEFDVADWEGALGEDGFIPIGDIELENGGKVDFEGNNHKITVVDSQNYQYLEDHKRIFEKENNYAMYYTIDDYVKTDLVLWLDGIENTRNGHNSSATVWEDLSTMENNAIGYNMNTNTGYYNDVEKGYVFLQNDSYMQTERNIGIYGDSRFTIETMIKVFPNPPFAASSPLWWGTGTSTTGESIFIGYNSSVKKIMFGFVNNSVLSNNTFELFNVKTNISFRKVSTGQISTGNTNLIKISKDGNNIASRYEGAKTFTTNLGNSQVQIGRAFQWNNENRPFNGIIYAIRIYNRVLTDEEIENNYKVDIYRYNR